MVEWMLNNKKMKNHLFFKTKATAKFLLEPKFKFYQNSKKQLMIMGCVVVILAGFLTFKGLSFGVDFEGGRTYVVRFDKDVEVGDVRESLTEVFGTQPEVKTFGPSYQVKITTDYKVKEDSETVKLEVVNLLYKGCKPFYNQKDITLEEFQSTMKNPLGIISSEIVGPTIAKDVQTSAVIAVILSLIAIFIYVFIRFTKWQYGFGGLVALMFDAFFTIGIYSVFDGILPFSMDVNMDFIAAVLTIIGYSINDTVIIFDRVRENLKLYPNRNYGDIMNLSINQTLSRTVNTVATVVVALLIIFIFGGEVLRSFAFALMVGTISGSFSTLFISSPIAYLLIKKENDKKARGLVTKKK
jgi:SecD/SecF fusion protein